MVVNNIEWHTFVWKAWHDNIYKEFITTETIASASYEEHYDKVFQINDSDGMVEEYNPRVEHMKVVRFTKNGKQYVLPTIFLEHIPLKISSTFDCRLKKAEKVLTKYITGIKPISVPSNNYDKTFREFIDTWNPIEHSKPLHWTLMKLLVFASKYKGIGLCACSEPAFGKNVNFTLLQYAVDRIVTIKTPTAAKLYQSVLTNDVIILDEFTTSKAEELRNIQNMILGLKDNSPELPKQSLAIGKQLQAADLVNKSIVFTYNTMKDIKKTAVFFDDKWDNPKAIQSRYPQFLFEGRVLESKNNPSEKEIEKALETDFIKHKASECSYWIKNLGTQLKGWDRSVLGLIASQKTSLWKCSLN
jgi:hypothetical protein